MLPRQFKLKNIELQIDQDLQLSHGGSVWDGALVLLHYIQKNYKQIQELVQDKCVLELGTGTGILGLSLSELSPSKIIMTDMEQNLPLIVHNYDINKKKLIIAENIFVEKLEWGEDNKQQLEKFLQKFPQIDIIIGSDLTYDDTNNIRLFETLKHIFTKFPQLIMILAFTMFKNTDDAFIEEYKQYFKFDFVKYSQMNSLFRSEDINIVYITINQEE